MKRKCLIPLSAAMYMQMQKERDELYKNWLETKKRERYEYIQNCKRLG